MAQLIQLIYCSAARHSFSSEELQQLLARARKNNAQLGLTGMLLYTDGSFFQVLEGEPATVDRMFEKISSDARHARVTVIIRETIPTRSFEEWTMGYASLSPEEAGSIIGAVDFFRDGASFDQLGPGRAKKLLEAFKEGRWRARLDEPVPAGGAARRRAESHRKQPPASTAETTPRSTLSSGGHFSFAYQPIIDISTGTVFSHEALIRGLRREPAEHVLGGVAASELHDFDEESRIVAIELAAKLGVANCLNLNFLPLSVASSPTAITSTIDAAARFGLPIDRIVLEVLERELIEDLDGFSAAVDDHRSSGLRFAIDDFGSGHAGLNVLAEFQPDFLKLDMALIRGIDRRGPRQAIIRGILRTCLDLGIEVIAEGIETLEEYEWLTGESIRLFQGYLLCRPAFEQLPLSFDLPG
jgi:EAL domain-containing protein (putative c-di-GMP-specific phosphodiesterase class I)